RRAAPFLTRTTWTPNGLGKAGTSARTARNTVSCARFAVCGCTASCDTCQRPNRRSRVASADAEWSDAGRLREAARRDDAAAGADLHRGPGRRRRRLDDARDDLGQ